MAENTVNMPSSSFVGVHHLKLPAKDIHKTAEFYSTMLPFNPLPQLEHLTPSHNLYSSVFIHKPTKLILEIRHDPEQAKLQKGWDPITWLVKSKADLEDWGTWFDSKKVKRSKVFMGLTGWVLACEDPDGRFVRLYTKEEHEKIEPPAEDDYWLGSVGHREDD